MIYSRGIDMYGEIIYNGNVILASLCYEMHLGKQSCLYADLLHRKEYYGE